MEATREGLLGEVVASFLKRKGYHQALEVIKQEGRVDINSGYTSSLDRMVFEGHTDLDVSIGNCLYTALNANVADHVLSNSIAFHVKIEDNYSSLRDWINNSSDKYKQELFAILYPVFIHCYIDLIEKGFPEEAVEFMNRHSKEHSDAHFGNFLIT